MSDLKFALGLLGALIAMLATMVFVGFVVSYTLVFLNFSGPESIVEGCFEAGFTFSLICSLGVGFFICRYLWIKYSAAEPE